MPAPSTKGVRPTSSRVREAIFSMIGQELSGYEVLDPFGGTGLLAAEAWSRGANVTVIERNARQAAAIRQTSQALGASWRIVVADSFKVAGDLGLFDVVLADPPYAMVSDQVVSTLAPCVRGLLMLEAPKDAELSHEVAGLTRFRRKRYGNTSIHLYQR